MGMVTEMEVGRFYAVDDMGNRYTVVRWQDMIVFRPLSGPLGESPARSVIASSQANNWMIALTAAS